jgi:hypothetical protein
MSFFYDLNKKLDGIRATPEVTNQQLNEQASPLTRILNERATKESMGFLGEKGVEEAYNPNSVGAENRRGLDASHAANLKKKAAAGDAKAQAALQHLKDKKERRGNDFNARMERESVGMDTGEPGIDSDLRDNILDVLNTILQGAIDGKEMIDTVADDLGDYFQDVKRSKDKTLRQAYKLMRRKGAEAEDNPEYMAQVAKQAIDLLSQQGMDEASKPDFLDIDKDGNTTEPMKSAARSARGMKEGGIPMTPKQQKFAKLAKPFDKITFADKIVGAKKAVDEMLGDVAADAMKKAVRGRDQDMEEASTGNAFDYKNFKQPEKQKPTSFVHKGTYGTEYDGDRDDARAIRTKKQAAAAAGQGSRGRGRPKKDASADTGEVMKPDFSAFGDKVKLKPFTGKITKHKMVGEDDLDPKDQGEYDQEGDMAKDSIKTVVRHAQALEKILGDDDNLPEWVQSKLAKIESMMTAVDDYMQNQADDMDGDEEQPIAEKAVSKKQQRFMGMVSAAKKGEKPASKEVAKVAKTMKKGDVEDFASTKHKGLPEKAAKKTKEVDETTTSGSMATSGSAAPKSSGGMSYGKGIYDSLNRKLEGMISESMNINMSMNNDDHGGPSRSLTVTATDEDAMALASMLRMAGMGGSNDHMPHMNNGVVQPDNVYDIEFDDGTDDLAAELSNELHGGDHSDDSEVCSTCGSSACGCDDSDTMDEAYGDTDATENHPDYPTDAEGTDDAMMYAGGPNDPKSTGQSTVPVIASQQDRQHAYENAAALRRMMEMAGVNNNAQFDESFGDAVKQGWHSFKNAVVPDDLKSTPHRDVNGNWNKEKNTRRNKFIHWIESNPGLEPHTDELLGHFDQWIDNGNSDDAAGKHAVETWKQRMHKYKQSVSEPMRMPSMTEGPDALRRMQEMAGLPVAEAAAPPVKLATPQAVDEPVSPASAAATPGKKPVVKPVTKSATPQDVPEPVKEDQMAHSLMRELHNFKY